MAIETDRPGPGDARGRLRRGAGAIAWPLEMVEQSIPARFAAIVRAFPDRRAVVVPGRSLTYAELDRQSASIATAISSAVGGVPDRPVAILLDQGYALPGATLGVLRTGAPYLPIDPAYPAAGLRPTLEHVQVSLILADSATVGLARSVAGDRPVIDLDAPRPTAEGDSAGPEIDPGDPATLYDTSGSGGRPKGVLDSHRNVLHNVRRYTNSLAIAPEDRLTLIHAPTFSGIVSSLFSGLLNGAAVLPFDLRHEGLARLGVWLRTERATMLHCVPAVFRGIAQGDAWFPSIRVVRLEGDQASWADVERFRRHVAPGAVLVNGLGATETGLTRQFFVGHDTPIGTGSLPIGYPIDGLDVAVNGDDGAPVVAGAVGEIVVRGRNLALGYWRDDARTRAAFSIDVDDPGVRTYRTGDLGRLDADGCLHHVGRLDQVRKIRGQTVDPGILEARLAVYPGIQEAIAITRVDGSDDVRLVAYIVLAPGTASIDPVALRRDLASRLPDTLVPSAIVVLEGLPLTASGKVDRLALPAPGRTRPSLPVPYVSPRDPLEEHLVATWESIIDVRPIGVQDDFFDLGGDSLAAATMLLEIGSAYERDLGPAVMTRTGTIESLAGEIRGSGPLADPRTAGQVERSAIFAVHALPDLPTFFHAVARHLPLWIGVHSLHPGGPADGLVPFHDVESEAAAYVDRIRAAQPSGPYHIAGFCYGGLVAFEIARQLRSGGDVIASLTLLGVTPLEFPTLMSPAARARYRRSEWRRRVRLLGVRFRSGGFVGVVTMSIRRSADLGRRHWFRRQARAAREAPRATAPDRRTASEMAIERYRSVPFDGDLTVVSGRDASPRFLRDPQADLAGLATGQVRLVLLPGDDHAMLSDPVANLLASQLSRRVTEQAVT